MKYRLFTAGVIAISSLSVFLGPLSSNQAVRAASADCGDPESYTQSLDTLGTCRGAAGLPTGSDESAAAYMTCLDRSLEAVLAKDLAEAIEAEDQQKIRIAELSLDTFKRYCNDVESEFIQVPERMDELVQTHVEHLADVIWTRLWQPQFIDYVLDPHGYARGYFSEAAWQILSADILETYDAQWFFDQEAMLSVALLDQDVAELEDQTWEVKATLAVRLYLGKSDERLELKHDERYLLGTNAKYVSDTNFAGLYLIETDADIAPVFEKIYETFPVEKGKGESVNDTPAN